MSSVQSTVISERLLTQAPQQYSKLKALGIVIYAPIQPLDVSQQPWLNDLCKLLSISTANCLFDANQPSFDDKLNQLHLPAFTYASEIDFKKLIWQNVRQFVT